jgi:glycosyltransferase involved in cell wall biosynthesis
MENRISIAMPTYEMEPYGSEFFDFSLNIISKQTHKNIEIVVSDNSEDDNIKDVCDKWKNALDITYVRYDKRGMSINTNNAINNCTSEYIKILYQDDYLFSNTSIEETMNMLDEKKPIWLASSCIHTHDGVKYYNKFTPRYHDNIWKGVNTISSPSVITVKNDKKLMFDTELTWLLDCDWYKRMYDIYGLPEILNITTVVNRTWGNRTSDTLKQETKNLEYGKVLIKHKK